jgi:hypothetical protein
LFFAPLRGRAALAFIRPRELGDFKPQKAKNPPNPLSFGEDFD